MWVSNLSCFFLLTGGKNSTMQSKGKNKDIGHQLDGEKQGLGRSKGRKQGK